MISLEDMAVSQESTETDLSTEETSTEVAESESVSTDVEVSTPEGEQVEEAASQDVLPAYEPDYSYKIKDEEKEFPEFLREAIKSKEQEDELRDYLTKANALDGIKESRTKIEDEFTAYKTEVDTHFNEKILPTLQTIGQFDNAVAQGDYLSAMKLADMEPKAVLEAMLMDDQMSDLVYKAAHEIIQLEEQGPEALAARKNQYAQSQEATKYKHENQTLQNRIDQMETTARNQMMDFALSQSSDAATQYDQSQGREGAFRELVTNWTELKRQQGENPAPLDVINEVKQMIGLQAPTSTTTQPQAQPAQQAPEAKPKTPVVPVMGAGTNQSFVGSQATSMDDYRDKMRAAAAGL